MTRSSSRVLSLAPSSHRETPELKMREKPRGFPRAPGSAAGEGNGGFAEPGDPRVGSGAALGTEEEAPGAAGVALLAQGGTASLGVLPGQGRVGSRGWIPSSLKNPLRTSCEVSQSPRAVTGTLRCPRW